MKKTILFGAAAIVMAAMASCSGKSTETTTETTSATETEVPATADKVEFYSGVLPAADCDGIDYALKLEFDDKGNEGDYRLTEAYLEATSATEFKTIKTFESEGDFTITTKDGKSVLTLVKKIKDGETPETTYFLVDNDSTITMTNQDLDVPTSGLNYSLKLVK